MEGGGEKRECIYNPICRRFSPVASLVSPNLIAAASLFAIREGGGWACRCDVHVYSLSWRGKEE